MTFFWHLTVIACNSSDIKGNFRCLGYRALDQAQLDYFLVDLYSPTRLVNLELEALTFPFWAHIFPCHLSQFILGLEPTCSFGPCLATINKQINNKHMDKKLNYYRQNKHSSTYMVFVQSILNSEVWFFIPIYCKKNNKKISNFDSILES